VFVQVEEFRRDHQLIEATFADEETSCSSVLSAEVTVSRAEPTA